MFSINEHRRLPYQMLVFGEVVRQGSFTAAAEALGHTKSAVSTYVSQLESHLAVQLLNRSTRKLTLTEAGQRVYQRSLQLTSAINDVLDDIDALLGEPQGRIAVTAPHAFEATLITPVIEQLCRTYPKLLPDMHYSDERLDILTHNLDMAISVGELADSRYRVIALGQLLPVLVAAPSYLAGNACNSAAVLSQHRLIQLPWQQQASIHHGQHSVAFHSDNMLKTNTVSSAIQYARHGLGIALLPARFVREELQRGELQPVLPLYSGEQRTVYAVHRYQTTMPLALQVMVKQLQQAFANSDSEPAG
ncbi:LysR family transcriptional regulator [Bacterioplanes sanyensis]|uniref:LysR family transcriptional regulator n=1 Tax=Bacterioplanes sanyensis TaxID=1249553 RepID=A0A222FGZ9_9GAMM|nr:LysR family transcriptional regulator [Bacterioplanes sanyensis]ASP38335.1 LysR family transcriptional regulator [Bacterioplanes sanyensis]